MIDMICLSSVAASIFLLQNVLQRRSLMLHLYLSLTWVTLILHLCLVLPRLCLVGVGAGRSVGEVLAAHLVFEETVPPDDLLATDVALIRPQGAVRLHVLGQVVLHLETLGTDGTDEGPQVQVLHLDVTVSHALQREGFTAVAEVHFACVGCEGRRRRGGGHRRGGRRDGEG